MGGRPVCCVCLGLLLDQQELEDGHCAQCWLASLPVAPPSPETKTSDAMLREAIETCAVNGQPWADGQAREWLADREAVRAFVGAMLEWLNDESIEMSFDGEVFDAKTWSRAEGALIEMRERMVAWGPRKRSEE